MPPRSEIAMIAGRTDRPMSRTAFRRAATLCVLTAVATAGVPAAGASGKTVDQLTETALAAAPNPGRGNAQFDRHCARCHGVGGQGDVDHRGPVLAGQRYAYLVRQMA